MGAVGSVLILTEVILARETPQLNLYGKISRIIVADISCCHATLSTARFRDKERLENRH